jgi:hypothetical protein
MRKRFIISIIIPAVCVAVLLATVAERNFPQSAKAVHASSAAPTLSVKPSFINYTVIDGSGSVPPGCTFLQPALTAYLDCQLTLTLTSTSATPLKWIGYHAATRCIYSVCNQDYNVAFLPYQGSLSTSSPKVQIDIIVPGQCYHGYENATFTFVLAGFTGAVAKTKYYCDQP